MKRLVKIFKGLADRAGELSPSCREATRLQSAALDHPLCWRQRLGLRIHLWLCRWCHRYGRQLKFLRHTARQHADHASGLPPQTLSPAARARLKQRLRENH